MSMYQIAFLQIELVPIVNENHSAVEALVLFGRRQKESQQVTCLIEGSTSYGFDDKKLKAFRFKGNYKEIQILPTLGVAGASDLVLCGIGQTLTAEKFRQTGARVLQRIEGGYSCIRIDATGLVGEVNHLKGLLEGLMLGSYEYNTYKASKLKKTVRCELLVTPESLTNIQSIANRVLTECRAVHFARRVIDLPANVITPTGFVGEVKEWLYNRAVEIESFEKEQLKKEKMRSILAVAQGSSAAPRFLCLKYSGAKKHSHRPIVLVGKGVTFDSGGLNIKSPAGMETMRYDMAGAAVVAAVLGVVADLKLDLNVVGLMPLVENMSGAGAYKPGDIIRSRNGKTIEIANTDAEGRVILADALSYAQDLKPSMIIDVATLAGSIAAVLGNIYSGYFTRNDQLAHKVREASAKTGERVWRLPLSDFHSEDTRGLNADLSNSPLAKGAGGSVAAAFLEHFIEKSTPWVHFDISGTVHGQGGRFDYCPNRGASGVLVRTLVEVLSSEKCLSSVR